jgi:hypothetical protein
VTIVNKGRAFHLAKFAKFLNYSRSSNPEFKRILEFLESEKLVVIQQGGYLGDNMHHEKIIAVLKPFELDIFKRKVLLRTNYTVGDFTVHVSQTKHICGKCHLKIRIGEHYGVKIEIGRKRSYSLSKKRIIFDQTIRCLPCLLEVVGLDEFGAKVY